MVDWEGFKNVLESQFEAYTKSGTDENEVATFLGNQYNLFMKNGQDIVYQNPVVNGNTAILIANLKIGFIQGKLNNDISYFIDGLKKGVVNYWRGAQLSKQNPPPSSTNITQNLVLNPGTFPDVTFVPSDKFSPFIDNLTNGMQTHLLSISGETTAMVQTPSGPTPQKFPWNGYN